MTSFDVSELDKRLGKYTLSLRVTETCKIECDAEREDDARLVLKEMGFVDIGSGHPIHNGCIYFRLIEVIGTK